MDTERQELADGQWAEFRTRLNHAQSRDINHVIFAEQDGKADDQDLAEIIGRTFCKAWRVRGLDGAELTFPDGWDEAPGEIVDAICTKAQSLWVAWRQAADPLGIRAADDSSDATSRALKAV